MSLPNPKTENSPSLEEQIVQLKEKVELMEKQQIEYLQNVSHQIVAPLNAMKWHIENLTEARISTDRAKKVMRSIYSQATLAVHLAKNFILMSNLEEDHDLRTMREPLQRVELRRLLINLADDFQPQGWQQDIKIKVDDANFQDFPPVSAIKPLISQVFSNILENAVKYSNRGSDVVVSGSFDQRNDTFSVHIRNLGLQLKPTDWEKVFDRTFRTDEAKRRHPAGTGFGLYIAQRIAAIHHGYISARMVDGWTIFSVTLKRDPSTNFKKYG